AVGKAFSSDAVYTEKLNSIQDHLAKRHGFPHSVHDLEGIEYVSHNFSRFGPSIHYGSSGRGGFGGVSYEDLMTATDAKGVFRSYLANEEYFVVFNTLETKIILVPVMVN